MTYVVDYFEALVEPHVFLAFILELVGLAGYGNLVDKHGAGMLKSIADAASADLAGHRFDPGCDLLSLSE